MPPNNPLSALKDIRLPEEIGFQLAWGWWVLLLLGLVVAVSGIVWLRFYLRFLREKALKKAMKKDLIQQLNALIDSDNFALECSILLRRYAHYYYPSLKINAFSEGEWVDFLGQKMPMQPQLKQLFLQAIYQKNPDFDKQALLIYSQKWIDYVCV